MTRYAASTSVSVEASRAEIERTLARYGADAFAYAIDGGVAKVAFRMQGRQYRFILTLPDRNADEFWVYERGNSKLRRVEAEGLKRWEQACRQKWRALALVIKAKLEAVAADISTIEDEFLAFTVMADGQTVGDAIRPQLEAHYQIGGPPRLLLEGPRP